jgi:hypothetical protein
MVHYDPKSNTEVLVRNLDHELENGQRIWASIRNLGYGYGQSSLSDDIVPMSNSVPIFSLHFIIGWS